MHRSPRRWVPFGFQREVWAAMAEGRCGRAARHYRRRQDRAAGSHAVGHADARAARPDVGLYPEPAHRRIAQRCTCAASPPLAQAAGVHDRIDHAAADQGRCCRTAGHLHLAVDGDTTAATREGAATTASGGPAVESASAALCCRASRRRPARMDPQAAKPAVSSRAMSLGPGTSLRRCREVTEPI